MKRYCGRLFSEADLTCIRALIQQCPQGSRRELSRRVCRELSWFKPDGELKDMSCRVAMLRMHADGRTIVDIAAMFRVSRPVIYRVLDAESPAGEQVAP